MKNYLSILIVVFLASCASHRHLHIHNGPMDEDIESEHVNYQEGILIIDNEIIDLPDGNDLSIRYGLKNGVSKYVVKVDGEIVAKKEAVPTDD